MKRFLFAGALTALLAAAPAFAGTVVYNSGPATGFFTPFNSDTPAGTRYGDSGWFGFGADAPETVNTLTLGLAVSASTAPAVAGNTDIVFTFNDGDPSGLVFGSGAVLYSTTIVGVDLPAAAPGQATYFELVVPIPNVDTLGGFNNFGFSIGVENFDYTGDFGFQNRGDFNNLGFYTNNASQFTPGQGWSLFAFGVNCEALFV